MGSKLDSLNVARGEIGYSRWDDPEPGTKYGRWYADYTGDSYFGESGVPYCAMFVSWCMNQADASASGIPGSYCPYILDAGRNEDRMVYNEDAEPGDMVLFDWGGDGVADHIGFVEVNYPDQYYMQTVEGNTSSGYSGSQSNGGGVYRRTRSYSSIIGVIRPYEDSTPQPQEPTEEELEQARIDALPDALKKFKDMYPDKWYVDVVNTAVERGIMSGTSDTTFEPEAILSRAMAVAVIANLLHADIKPLPFTDIAEWYTADAIWAEGAGILKGSGGEMRPNDGCTREEFAVFLWRSQSQPTGYNKPEYFSDWGSVSDWAQDAMSWAVNKGIIGNGGSLRPGYYCSRAEAAAMAVSI